MTAPQIADIVWGGQQEFALVGTDHGEDTLRIEANYSRREQLLRLTLPTLCITYASMPFANAIGGTQENYPASRRYGPAFFDPPVVMDSEEEVEKFTWIRGARRVAIGPGTTDVWWFMGKSLVIPRLRLDKREPVTAVLTIPATAIAVDKPLIVDVSQYADGRQLGGIRLEKRHPQWRATEVSREYDLWVRVVNGETLEPMPEVALELFRWDPGVITHYGTGGFSKVEEHYTGSHGTVHGPHRPSDELEAVTLRLRGWRAVARCFRPLPGQRVRFQMQAWKLHEDAVPYTWSASDTLERMALLTGHAPAEILQRNKLPDPLALQPGMTISLPCYEARYRLEAGDTLEWLAAAFAYAGVDELATLNGVSAPGRLYTGMDIRLPGWHFFYAGAGDSLEQIDAMFGLPRGSSCTVGRVHHPDPRLPYEAETVAVPTEGFARTHSRTESESPS